MDLGRDEALADAKRAHGLVAIQGRLPVVVLSLRPSRPQVVQLGPPAAPLRLGLIDNQGRRDERRRRDGGKSEKSHFSP